tara:strand:+ start:2169 stop:2387 length:219 start_codon:yes stop_codon:yes gene_type:complete
MIFSLDTETKMKAWLDKHVNKFMSRKLLVWLTSTGLLINGSIDGEQWVALALAYVGVQGFADLAVKWKRPQA